MAGTVSQHDISGNATLKTPPTSDRPRPSRSALLSIEGGLRKRKYQREFAVGTQESTASHRVWPSRVDSVLKLDRAPGANPLTRTKRRRPAEGHLLPPGCWNYANGAVRLVGALTDPPYGIELDSEWRDRAGLNTAPGHKQQ